MRSPEVTRAKSRCVVASWTISPEQVTRPHGRLTNLRHFQTAGKKTAHRSCEVDSGELRQLSRVGSRFVVVTGASFAALGIWLRGSAIAEQFLKLQIDLPLAAHKLYGRIHSTDWGQWFLGTAQR
jgi:hypothetical protein